MVRRLGKAVALAAFLALAPAAAQAATFAVNTTQDPPGPGCMGNGPCSIRQALTIAAPGDTITIPASGSHYVLTQGQLTVANPVSIDGAGLNATVIDAQGNSRVLAVDTPSGTTTLSGLTLTGGSLSSSGPAQGGGGIYLQNGGLTLSGVSVSHNSIGIDPAGGTDGGGGILDASTGPLTLNYSLVTDDTAKLTGSGPGGGGGILDLTGPLTLLGTSVDDNALSLTDPNGGTDGGGGIYLASGSTAKITDSTLAGNTAALSAAGGSNGGGGIYDASGSSTYLNDTFSADALTVAQTSSNGGGAIFHEGAPGTISDVTIAQNHSSAGAGGIFDNVGAYTLKNTIVAQNGTGCGGAAGVVSAGYNLEGSATCNMTMPSDLRNANPQLGPLGSYGGPTLTQDLTPASPAIDAGSCTDASGNPVSTDQRGVPRPQPAGGRCDIGAFEYEPASPAPLVVGGSRPVVDGSTRATFSGLVNPGGLATTAHFEYGLDARYRLPGGGPYDHSTPAVRIAGGYGPVTISATVSGLVPAALYHVRLVVANGAGSMVGPDQTFVTARDPAPPPPVLGRSIDAAPAAGLVRVLIGRSFVPLTEPRRLALGTEVDARHGMLVITGAGGGGLVSATLSGAVFRISQILAGPNRGLLVAALADGAFAGVPAYGSCRGRTPRVLQSLHANVSGRFRVSGRFSTGTARDGQWATSDRCDGTVTSVHRGPVLVTNLRRNVSVTLRAGASHLAGR